MPKDIKLTATSAQFCWKWMKWYFLYRWSTSGTKYLTPPQHPVSVMAPLCTPCYFTLSVYMKHENVSCAFLYLSSFYLILCFLSILRITIFLHLSILAPVGIGKRYSSLSKHDPSPSHGHHQSTTPWKTLDCMPIDSTSTFLILPLSMSHLSWHCSSKKIHRAKIS